MAKVTSKLQVTVPKALAERYGICAGDEIGFEEAGETIRVVPANAGASARGLDLEERLRLFDAATDRQRAREAGRQERGGVHMRAGPGASSTSVATRSLIDTNILVYRYDPRFPDKQRIATGLLRDGIVDGTMRLPHQAIVEFVAAAAWGGPENRLLEPSDARREAEEFMAQSPILYPDDAVLRTALRGMAAYRRPGSTRSFAKSTDSLHCCPRTSRTGACTEQLRSETRSRRRRHRHERPLLCPGHPAGAGCAPLAKRGWTGYPAPRRDPIV